MSEKVRIYIIFFAEFIFKQKKVVTKSDHQLKNRVKPFYPDNLNKLNLIWLYYSITRSKFQEKRSEVPDKGTWVYTKGVHIYTERSDIVGIIDAPELLPVRSTGSG